MTMDNLHQRYFLKMSAYLITFNHIYDLLNEDLSETQPQIQHFLDQNSDQVISKLVNLNERLILAPGDYKQAIGDAYKQRKYLSQTIYRDKDLRKKSHFIVSLSLFKKVQDGFQQLSTFNLVELTGSEQAVGSSEKRDGPRLEFVSKSFNSLSSHLMHLIPRKKASKQNPDQDSSLVQCLKATMTQDSCITLITTLDPCPEMYKHSLPALKFCASIRE